MARANFPALHVAAIWDDAVAPQQEDFVRLGVEHALLELAHQLALPREIGLAEHAIVDVDFLRVLLPAEIRAGCRARQVFSSIEQRIDDVLAIAVDRHGKLAAAQRVPKWAGLHDT